MNRQEAWELVKKYNKDQTCINHYLETEAIMRALARKFEEDEELWGLLGLLHDIDWEITKDDNIYDHCVKCVEILKEAGLSDEFISIIQSHGYGAEWEGKPIGEGKFEGKKRERKAEHALAAAETITGLIYAYALMRKGLEGMKVKGLKKKFKDKSFAPTVDREIIREIEKTDLTLAEFFEISIKAMQSISEELGL